GFGKATYYGAAVQGNGTASGETFDMNVFTAAHKTLPFGTIVKATNLANGKSVEVKINDRGPYGAGRVLDLSSSAFKELAPLSTGVITIQYEVIPQ
ncbi:MAG: septal ring lytic transglycosylase RlpA family protein, partial [Candidatus Gracilibacteria bacterium]